MVQAGHDARLIGSVPRKQVDEVVKWIVDASRYAEAGQQVGQAQREGNVARVKERADWARRAMAMEDENVQTLARRVFDDAYRDATLQMPRTAK